MPTIHAVRGDIVSFQQTIASALNKLARLSVGSFKHYAADNALTYSTLSGSDTAATNAAIAAGNQLMVRYTAHLNDDIAHIAKGTVPALTPATSLATLLTLINAIKADYNTHIGDTALHPNADATNTIAASDATNLATAQTMLNEFLNTTGYQQHAASAPAADSIRVVEG